MTSLRLYLMGWYIHVVGYAIQQQECDPKENAIHIQIIIPFHVCQNPSWCDL